LPFIVIERAACQALGAGEGPAVGPGKVGFAMVAGASDPYNGKTIMNKSTIILVLSVWFAVAGVCAQPYQKTDFGIRSTVHSMNIEVQFYSPSLVRVLKSPEGSTFTKQSLSVIQVPQKTSFAVDQAGDDLSLRSARLWVKLDLNNGQISYMTASGEPLLDEKGSGVEFTDFNDAGVKTHSVRQSFLLEKDEAIYGLGQQQQGKMVQRNLSLNMIQGNTDDYVPFFQSVKGYGLFWDNYSPTLFVDDSAGTSFKSDVGDCVDYYFMYGSNADGVIAQMRGLTGQVPMFPLWTFGYWQSKERYKSQFETVEVVRRYRELGVPLDGIIQDWQYWGDNFHWNAMEFLNPHFPDPKKMIDTVHSMNAHIIISVWASFGPQTRQFEIMNKKGMLFDFKTWPMSSKDEWPPDPKYPSGVKVYDVYSPEARGIFWHYLNKGLFSLGIDGWWLDSSEPDHMDVKPSDFDTKTYLGSFRKVRNAFPLMHIGGVYDHQRSVSSSKRVFILTRSGFAGQQRYGSNVWSGDVVASWSALRNQISAGLNWSLCGIPYWNSDIGGFFLWNFPRKLEDVSYRELYVRWVQFGAFCPMMRSHGTDAPREIYQFGKKGDTIYDAIEKSIHLRYSLLPYIYSVSWDVTANQSTMMRALVMDFPNDRRALDINDQYMFGKSVLVCPVTDLMYADSSIHGSDTTIAADFSKAKKRTLYLPRGTGWIDFWSGEKLEGGQEIAREAPIDIIPLFVKAGTILPIGPRVQYASEKKWDDLEIRVYPGADGVFRLYEDENDNYDYEKGSYSTITFTWDNESKALIISERKGSFPGMLAERKFNIVQVVSGKGMGMNGVEQYDTVVTYDGKRVIVTL
jgi:alpha-D-xyloside xylohydrolase